MISASELLIAALAPHWTSLRWASWQSGYEVGDIITNKDKYKRGWTGGLPETECGSGSKVQNTELQRDWIPEIIEKYGIKTIADIGAGDLNWIKHMDLSGIDYAAYDLVPRHESVVEFNLVEQVAPKVDLILCLWVLNHFPIESSRMAIHNLKASGSKYLMMTDRPKYHADQPEEIHMPYIEKMPLNEKDDSIMLINLQAC